MVYMQVKYLYNERFNNSIEYNLFMQVHTRSEIRYKCNIGLWSTKIVQQYTSSRPGKVD